MQVHGATSTPARPLKPESTPSTQQLQLNRSVVLESVPEHPPSNSTPRLILPQVLSPQNNQRYENLHDVILRSGHCPSLNQDIPPHYRPRPPLLRPQTGDL